MTTPNENMVLRTIYLPKEIDRRLKALAFAQDISKGELIRKLITDALPGLQGQTLGSRIEASASKRAAKPVKPKLASAAAKAASPAASPRPAKAAAAPLPLPPRPAHEAPRAKSRQAEELAPAE